MDDHLQMPWQPEEDLHDSDTVMDDVPDEVLEELTVSPDDTPESVFAHPVNDLLNLPSAGAEIDHSGAGQ